MENLNKRYEEILKKIEWNGELIYEVVETYLEECSEFESLRELDKLREERKRLFEERDELENRMKEE